MKYRKKPIEIEALQWTGENQREMFDFLTNYEKVDEYMNSVGDNFYIDHDRVRGGLVIKTLGGEHIASINDVIIKGINGEFYPCKSDIFEKSYEKVIDTDNNDVMQDTISKYITYLNRNGYIVKKWTKDMQVDSDECVELDEKGKSKDCCGCSCSVCLMQ